VNFLNVGPWELTLIIIIAILVVGPKRMVEVTRVLGRTMAQLRRFSNEFLLTLQTEVNQSSHPSAAPTDVVGSIAEPIIGVQRELMAIGRETQQALQNIVSGEGGGAEASAQVADIQAGLMATASETRQALAGIEGSKEGAGEEETPTEEVTV